MEISQGMINYYLEEITFGWFDTNDLPADNVEDYYDKAMYIRDIALEKGDLEYLKIGLDYFLCNKEIDLEDHGYVYPWTAEEVRELIRYLISVIYPNHKTNCDKLQKFYLTNTTKNEWWKMRKEQGLHPNESPN